MFMIYVAFPLSSFRNKSIMLFFNSCQAYPTLCRHIEAAYSTDPGSLSILLGHALVIHSYAL